jgi:WD40 repeat protein
LVLLKIDLIFMNQDRQPGPDDAVLGGTPVDLSSAAILGGIEGVKLSLQSGNESARLTALPKALNYGEAGLDLVINALEDPDLKLKAYKLLRKRTEPQASQALKGFNGYHFYQNLKTLGSHTDSVCSVAITPDGQSIVSGSHDYTIKIWGIPS